MSRLLRFLVDLILPPRCLGCADIILESHSLCASCWKKCTFLSSPLCAQCGWPFSHEASAHTLCLACHRLAPPYVQCRSALAYDEGCQHIILRFKQGDGLHLASGLGKLMLAAGQEILFATDMLIPVPLHWKRLWFRQYNQSALLASHLSVHTGIQLRSDILKRHRSTPKQGMKNRKARHDNVRKAFSVSSRKAAFCKGQRITLIDDVFTTGATLGECAKTLLSAGAKEIRVLTLARVVQPGYI